MKAANAELPSTSDLRALANAGRPISHQARDLVLARTLGDPESKDLPRDLADWVADCCSQANVQPIIAAATTPADRLGFWWTMAGNKTPSSRLHTALRRTHDLPEAVAEGHLRAAQRVLDLIRARQPQFVGWERELLDATLEFLTVAPVWGVDTPHTAESNTQASQAASAFVAKWSSSSDVAVRGMVKWVSVRYGQ